MYLFSINGLRDDVHNRVKNLGLAWTLFYAVAWLYCRDTHACNNTF